MDHEKRIVFVLGAGASVHAGIPVLQNFLLRTFTILETETLAPGTTGLGGHPSDFSDFRNVLDCWMKWSRKTWNIEDFFQYVDDQDTKEMKKLRVELIWTMFRTMQLSEEQFRHRKIGAFGYSYHTIEIYEKFAAQIKQMIQDNIQVQIVTLNQDILLDQALMRIDIRPEYHLEKVHPSNDPIGTIPINFLKIHGSVNWRVYVNNPPTTDTVEVHWDAGPGNWHTGKPQERHEKTYLLVPPSNKGREAPPLKPIRAKAEKAIQEASDLVFLGIGFPPSDDVLAREFSKWASEGPRKTLHVWNPDRKVEDTYKKFFTKNVEFPPHPGKPQGTLEYFVLEEKYKDLR
ncbi:MAG: hypothetical protein AB7G75_31695 [Candidatus Binatia bacterium]